jgi:hypothetical protein
MAQLASTASTLAGANGTLVLREKYDDAGDSGLMRPSVLYGVGLGSVALALDYAVSNQMIDPVGVGRDVWRDVMPNFGLAALGTGVMSLFLPKGGGGFSVPTM